LLERLLELLTTANFGTVAPRQKIKQNKGRCGGKLSQQNKGCIHLRVLLVKKIARIKIAGIVVVV
jgi:hypothetical protein